MWRKFGNGKNDIEKRSDELLTLVGLSKENHRIRGVFQGGMKQRLGIAQALLGRPPKIFDL